MICAALASALARSVSAMAASWFAPLATAAARAYVSSLIAPAASSWPSRSSSPVRRSSAVATCSVIRAPSANAAAAVWALPTTACNSDAYSWAEICPVLKALPRKAMSVATCCWAAPAAALDAVKLLNSEPAAAACLPRF